MWTIYAAIVEMIGKLNHTDYMNLMSQESRLWIAFKMLASFAWMKMSLNMNMWKWVNVKLNKNMNMNMNMNMNYSSNQCGNENKRIITWTLGQARDCIEKIKFA